MPKRPEQSGRIRKLLQDFFDGIATLRSRPKTSILVLLAIVLQNVLIGLRFFIAAKMIGAEMSVSLLLLLAPLANLTGFVAITPGGVGIRETLMGYVTYAIGDSFSYGAFVGTVDRALLLAVVSVVGGACFLLVWRRVKRAGVRGTELAK